MNSEVCAAAAQELFEQLKQHDRRIVFAESCTGGRIAASLCELPGISSHLCGSFVVYRNDSKQRWLGIPANVLDDPSEGPVSSTASELLAQAALRATPEADIALAITGDVGPGAPVATDGCVFLSVATQQGQAFDCRELVGPLYLDPCSSDEIRAVRRNRLEAATEVALKFAAVVCGPKD